MSRHYISFAETCHSFQCWCLVKYSGRCV